MVRLYWQLMLLFHLNNGTSAIHEFGIKVVVQKWVDFGHSKGAFQDPLSAQETKPHLIAIVL